MPQNAIIKADGTGNYTTVQAWRSAEAASNYGAPTRAYVSGTVAAGGTIGFRTGTTVEWINGAELYALPGEEFNGSNAATCARITHTAAIIDIGDADFTSVGLAYGLTNAYNADNIRTNVSKITTVRRTVKLHNLYLEGSQYYHAAANVLKLTNGQAANERTLDVDNVIINPRASVKGLIVTATATHENFKGSIKNITILPASSGSSTEYGFGVIGGDLCTDLNIDSVLSLGSQVRTNYKDFDKDVVFAGTATNIVTADNTGTITGKTTTSELENYAAGDYRLSASGLGFGAFPQAVGPDTYSYDVDVSWPVFSVSASQSSTVPEYSASATIQWPIFNPSVNQSSSTPVVQCDVVANWPLFSVNATQQYTPPDTTTTVTATWPLFEASVGQTSTLPDGSTQVSAQWPIFSVSSEQSSTVPQYDTSVRIQWPLFSVSADTEQTGPTGTTSIELMWPLFSVSASQSSAKPLNDSNVMVQWPMFGVVVSVGELNYTNDPLARVDLPFTSSRIDLPSLSRRIDL